MSAVTPTEAFEYALGREMLRLYLLVALGYVTFGIGGWFATNWAIRGAVARLLGQILAIVFLLVGFIVIVGGLVAVVYKLIADANRVARV